MPLKKPRKVLDLSEETERLYHSVHENSTRNRNKSQHIPHSHIYNHRDVGIDIKKSKMMNIILGTEESVDPTVDYDTLMGKNKKITPMHTHNKSVNIAKSLKEKLKKKNWRLSFTSK